MSAPSPPPDNSAQVAQINADAAAKKDAADKAAADLHTQQLQDLRSSSRAGGLSDANTYFSSRGLDPAQYSGDIQAQLDSIASKISPTDENPGQFYNNFGQNAFNTLQTGFQSKEQAALNNEFAPNFETQRIPFSLANPYEQGIEAEQRSNADSIIKNMLDRGVITATGYAAAQSDLDKQAAGVNTKLNEFGTGVIASGQQKLKDVANNARQTAGTLQLGQSFDPQQYGTQADQVFNDFVSTLGDQIRSKVTGNLFNTTGLASLAGAAQGAGNTAFNPAAAAGVNEDNTPTQTQPSDQNKESIF